MDFKTKNEKENKHPQEKALTENNKNPRLT